MASIRIVLLHSREQGRTDPGMDQFIFGLPEYACPGNNPRPRPLSFGDFELLVSADSLRTLDEVDADNIGLSDIWLTQAFQGGRISETLKLRLGCVGLIGAAQPYIWRDITKVNVIDYGMPCHLPVYERLLRRQSITRTKLRNRYADQLAELDNQARARLEARWDQTMPLFPGNVQNPDLAIEVSQSRFRKVWTEWFEGLAFGDHDTSDSRHIGHLAAQ